MSNKTSGPKSYAEFARKRVETLEAIVSQKLKPFSSPSSSGSEDETVLSSKGEEEIHDYIDWLKCQLQHNNPKKVVNSNVFSNNTTGLKSNASKRERSTRRAGFDYSSDSSNITCRIQKSSSLCSPKYLGPVKVGRYNLSTFLQLVMEVYCNKLDPNLFWLSRDQVERVVRSPNNSLLKYLIIDSSLNVSTLTKRERSQISFLYQDISSLTVSCYNNLSLDSIVALALLATEEYLKYNITSAKMFLGKAFRLADLLKVNPDFREDIPNFFETSEIFNKDRLWESLLLVHANIFFEVPGPPFGKCSTINSFPHVGSKELSFPTISRVLSVPESEKIPVHTILRNFESCIEFHSPVSDIICNEFPFKQKRRTLSGKNLSIYMETLQIYMKLYQFSLQVQHQYFANPYKLRPDELFLPKLQKRLYSSKILQMLKSLPSYFIKPQVLTIRSFWDEFTPNHSNGQDSSTLGNLIYVILLSCLISVNYPHIWFDPQPFSLPDSESWQLALDGSDALYKFFLAFSSLLQITKHTDFLIFNLGDSLSAIYTYLNAILNCPYLTQQHRGTLFNRAQTIVNEIKLLSQQKHQVRHTNAKKVLATLKKSLMVFPMPEEFQLDLDSIKVN